MRNLISSILCFITITIFFIHCGSAKNLTDEKPQIDPNFEGYNGTILIVRNTDASKYNNVDRTLRKNFEKKYKGIYLFISNKDKDDPKYADMDKYQFLIVPDLLSQQTSSTGFITSSRINMIDRKTGKEYHTKIYSSYDAFKEYPLILENSRISK